MAGLAHITRELLNIRTTNVVESPFAALRLRTDAAKRFVVWSGARR